MEQTEKTMTVKIEGKDVELRGASAIADYQASVKKEPGFITVGTWSSKKKYPYGLQPQAVVNLENGTKFAEVLMGNGVLEKVELYDTTAE